MEKKNKFYDQSEHSLCLEDAKELIRIISYLGWNAIIYIFAIIGFISWYFQIT